jgi:hypothetical protein
MASIAPKERVAGLVDIVDETEDLAILMMTLLWRSEIKKSCFAAPKRPGGDYDASEQKLGSESPGSNRFGPSGN